ncbi:Biotin/lipoate A/B protein ligase [Serendipita sp. 399]|nr:Biotin/lipoate A/B protein ligase [Serendipita sp. 399]
MTFNEAKERVLSALTEFPDEKDVPNVKSTNDFEICVGRLSKKSPDAAAKLEFEIIDGEKRMRDVFSKPWEVAYLKFRNPDEINQTALKEANVPFIRRRSGGGTVYHDLGNTNFSLHLPRASFDRKKGSELAVRALKNLDVPDVWVNERNDVCVGKYKIGLLSCSAYKIINARAYHHGTMLLNARIDLLGDVLRNTKETMVGKSVPSVRSPVRNIVEFKSDITHEAFAAALCTAFSERFDTENKVVSVGEAILDDDRYMSEREFIQKSMTELEAKYLLLAQHAEIVAKHGIITSCRLLADGNEVDSLNAALVGKRYGLLSEDEFDPILDDLAVVRWLQGEM